MHTELKLLLENLYTFLRDEGFSKLAVSILKLLQSLEQNNIKEFRRNFKSIDIWGGAGSISDISFRDSNKQGLLEKHLLDLKTLGKKI